jgi:hypothetical protein
MKVFVNFGYHKLPEVKSLGFDGVRLDVEGDIPSLVNHFIGSGVRPLFLLHDVALNEPLLDVALQAGNDWFDIEVFNEPPGMDKVNLSQYVAGINAVNHDARARGFKGRIIAGAKANPSQESMAWYEEAVPQLPDNVVVAFHRYSYKTQTDPSRPWPPFSSRQAEVAEMFKVSMGRKVAITEFGYHTAEEVETKFSWKFPFYKSVKTRLTDQQVLDFLVSDLKLYESMGVGLVAIYQWRDGHTDDYLGRYGLHDVNEHVKLQSQAVIQWRGL